MTRAVCRDYGERKKAQESLCSWSFIIELGENKWNYNFEANSGKYLKHIGWLTCEIHWKCSGLGVPEIGRTYWWLKTPSSAVNSEILPHAEDVSELQAAEYWENTLGNISPSYPVLSMSLQAAADWAMGSFGVAWCSHHSWPCLVSLRSGGFIKGGKWIACKQGSLSASEYSSMVKVTWMGKGSLLKPVQSHCIWQHFPWDLDTFQARNTVMERLEEITRFHLICAFALIQD